MFHISNKKTRAPYRYLEIKPKGVQGLNEVFKGRSESTSKNFICYESYAVNGTTTKPRKKRANKFLNINFRKLFTRVHDTPYEQGLISNLRCQQLTPVHCD
jgi:hypothetical protein